MYFKGQDGHPLRLYKWMAACSTTIFGTSITCHFYCSLNLDYLLAFTSPWYKNFTPIKAVDYAFKTKSYLIFTAVVMINVINICLSIDLIMILRQPFSQHEKRIKWYLLASVLIATCGSIFSIASTPPYYERNITWSG